MFDAAHCHFDVRWRTDAKLSVCVLFPRREEKGISSRPAIIAIVRALAGKMLRSVASAIEGLLYACAEALLSTARDVIVFYYALIFFVIALISGALVFARVAGVIAGVAQFIFFRSLALCVTLFILSKHGRSIVASTHHTDGQS